MADDLIFPLGTTARIVHTVTADDPFAVSAVTISIFNLAGTAIVTAATGDFDSAEEATSHQVYYLWTPATADDYTYALSYTVGGQTLVLRGRVLVWPLASKFDPYIARIQSWLQETEIGEAQQKLSLRDYRDAVRNAVRVYEKDRPRELLTRLTLAADTYEYSLPDADTEDILGEVFEPPAPWDNQFSQFLGPPVPTTNYTAITPLYPAPKYAIDERRGKWRFQQVYPPLSGQVDLAYTARHQLSHTADTLPAADFEAICQYAAGSALLTLASKAAGTEAPEVAAGIVSYRDQTQRYRQLGMDFQKAAPALWQPAETVVEKRAAAGTLDLLTPAGSRYYSGRYLIANAAGDD